MCSGPKTPSSPPPPPVAPKPATAHSSLLLELAASDDLPSFIHAISTLNLSPSTPSLWYSRSLPLRRMSLESRTPLHIAALYGSTSIVNYLLTLLPRSAASLPSGSDLATPLHLAAISGTQNASSIINVLLSASADPEAKDSAGHRPADILKIVSSNNNTNICISTKQTAAQIHAPDLTLPDIKTGIYGTDEFRIYTFKVKPCSRAYSHDWTECPFVHPGENARRRDPRKYLYSSIPCPEFRKSAACRNGDGCEYAHGVFESWLHPAQYRTRLCKDETGCNRRVCFFAHKVEELRTVNQSAGLSLSLSPRATSVDMAAALMMMQQGAPMSPSMPNSRLKTSMSARDLEFDSMDLLGLEGYLSSPRATVGSGLRMNGMAAASRGSEYSELMGTLDRSVISQLQGLSMQQQTSAAAQYQSSQQMNYGYGSSSLGLDHSTAKAIMNSRASAFAKRSQSFVGRSSATPIANPASGWGSPNGKLDWGIQGEELNKLRKSASFGIRSSYNSNGYGGLGVPGRAQNFDEPDVSWVHSLVKDGPVATRHSGQQQQQQQYRNSDMLSPWAEKEQMVA